MGGAWFLYLGLRSWHGLAPQPSANLAFAGNSARMTWCVDRCILPLSLLYLSLRITLGLAGAPAQLCASRLLPVPVALAPPPSGTFPPLTTSVYRHWNPRRL